MVRSRPQHFHGKARGLKQSILEMTAIPEIRCSNTPKYARAWIVRSIEARHHGRVPETSDCEFGTGGHTCCDGHLSFLVVALVAAVFGFGGIAAASAGIARILFFIFLILFVASLLEWPHPKGVKRTER